MDSYPLRLPLLGANSSGDFRSTADYSAIFLNVMPFRSVVPEKTSGAWVCRPGAAARAVIQSKQAQSTTESQEFAAGVRPFA